MNVYAILLAGGTSSRFTSPIPKVLYPLQGQPMIEYLLDTLQCLPLKQTIIVSGQRTDHHLQRYTNSDTIVLRQEEPLGTFDALLTAIGYIRQQDITQDKTTLLVINGDTPAIRASFLQSILDHPAKNVVTTKIVQNPTGLGRVIRNSSDELERIIEEKELEEGQHLINEINAGVYKLNFESLELSLGQDFSTCEKYLTSYLGSYQAKTLACECLQEEPMYAWSLSGVNTLSEFEQLEESLLHHKRQKLLAQGAILENAKSIFIKGHVSCQPGVRITGPCQLYGPLSLGQESHVEAFSVLESSSFGQSVHIQPFCHISQASIGDRNQLGPFLRLRQEVNTGQQVSLGNFLEVKKTSIASLSKIKHFGYIGDGTVGTACNIGAGVIFCNYDGFRKRQTTLGDNVFVGAGSSFVAPLTIGEKSYIGASTLVTQSFGAHTLVTRRAPLKSVTRQKHKES